MVVFETLVQQLINGIVLSGYYAIIALGLAIIFGTLGVVNVAHGGFVTIGAYTAYLATDAGMPYVGGVVLAIVVTFVFGGVVDRLLVKPFRDRSPLTVMLSTLGLLLVIQATARHFFPSVVAVTTPWSGVSVPVLAGFSLELQRVLLLVVAIVLIAVVHVLLTHTRTGTIIRATAEDVTTASMMGVDADRYLLLVFCAGSAMAGLAGAIIAPVTYVSPSMGLWPTLVGLFTVIVGGLGNYRGALIAAFMIGLLESISILFIPTNYRHAIVFVFIAIVIYVRPEGLFETKAKGVLEFEG